MNETETKYKIIDAWTQPALVSMYEKLPEVASLFRRSGSSAHAHNSLSPEDTVALMDKAGIEKVLLRAWCRPGQWVCTNEQVLEYTSKFPDRFIGVAVVKLDLPPSSLKRFFYSNAKRVFNI